MKKALFSVIGVFCCIVIFSGCIKNTPYVTTLDPYMTASIGTYNFTAKTVVPSLVDTQAYDSVTALQITGNSADLFYVNDKIVLYVSKWKKQTGVFSMVQGQANGIYYHNGIPDPALGGIVAITKITSNSIIGYFSFNTASGANITNGEYSVGLPWNY
jgi:hypothetical protein